MSEVKEKKLTVSVDGDPFLKMLIRARSGSGMDRLSWDITLSVGGCLISGRLISASQYMRDFTPNMEDALKDAGLRIDGKPEELDSIRFIHLADARFYYANQQPIPANQGVLWRGMLSSVDGFHLGRLKVAMN